MNASTNEQRDVYLTIVPDDLAFGGEDALQTIVDVTEEADGAPSVPTPGPTPVDEPFSIEPAPQRSKAPLLVAGALGGGMIFGGGAVALLGLMAVVGLGAVGGTAWWLSAESSDAAPEAVPALEEPVEADAPEADPVAQAEGTADDAEAPQADAEAPADDVPASADADADAAPARPAPAPAAPAPSPNPAAPTPTPDYAQAPAAPAPAAAPASEVTVKLLSDPPAATVTVDGVPMGRTPLKTTLTPETHTVVIESGKASDQFTIDASSGDRFCFGSKRRKVWQEPCN